jgi:hypothetical protein
LLDEVVAFLCGYLGWQEFVHSQCERSIRGDSQYVNELDGLDLPAIISYSVDSETAEMGLENQVPDFDFQDRFCQGVSAWFNLPQSSPGIAGNDGPAHLIVASQQLELDSAKLGKRQFVAQVALVLSGLKSIGDLPFQQHCSVNYPLQCCVQKTAILEQVGFNIFPM